MNPITYSMQRFLAAKRSVDDRAINRVVLSALQAGLAARGTAPLRVLELGAGLGNMVARLSEWGVLGSAHYTLLDRDAQSLRQGIEALTAWGEHGARVSRKGHELEICSAQRDLAIAFETADLFDFLSKDAAPSSYDLVIAHAVLDIVHVPSLLPLLWRALVPAGLVWFTINFDGESIFLPARELDRSVLSLYHGSMDHDRLADGRAGDSQTGRRLLEQLPESGASVLSAGSSDWVVWPNQRAYPDDETYFLHHIVHTIDCELRGHAQLDHDAFQHWVDARHRQIEEGKLIYIAHQLDVLARAPG
jgi:SAM-dependent methyltransferase